MCGGLQRLDDLKAAPLQGPAYGLLLSRVNIHCSPETDARRRDDVRRLAAMEMPTSEEEPASLPSTRDSFLSPSRGCDAVQFLS